MPFNEILILVPSSVLRSWADESWSCKWDIHNENTGKAFEQNAMLENVDCSKDQHVKHAILAFKTALLTVVLLLCLCSPAWNLVQQESSTQAGCVRDRNRRYLFFMNTCMSAYSETPINSLGSKEFNGTMELNSCKKFSNNLLNPVIFLMIKFIV